MAGKKFLAPKALRDSAKKFGIDFDHDTTEAELQILVDSAEAAEKAQIEQSGGVAPADEPESLEGPELPDTGTAEVPASQGEPEEVDPNGGVVLQEHKGIKLIHIAATKKDKESFILRNVAGQLLGSFESREEGLKHIENLTRF